MEPWANSAEGHDGAPDQSTASVDSRFSLARKIATAFVAISTVLSAVTSVSLLSNEVNYSNSDYGTDYFDDSTSDDTYVADDAWVPAGFTTWYDDSNIAWKWATNNDCDVYSCVSAEFISEYGCSGGLYVAVNWLDDNDAVVSYSNESLPSLQSQQVAKLRFDDYEEVGASGQISEINCN